MAELDVDCCFYVAGEGELGQGPARDQVFSIGSAARNVGEVDARLLDVEEVRELVDDELSVRGELRYEEGEYGADACGVSRNPHGAGGVA